MSGHPRPDGMAAGYEALRAEATGGLSSAAPRGRALVLGQGLPAWIRAWAATPVPAALRPVPAAPPPCAPWRSGDGALGAEVVRLLAEMALGARPALVGLP